MKVYGTDSVSLIPFRASFFCKNTCIDHLYSSIPTKHSLILQWSKVLTFLSINKQTYRLGHITKPKKLYRITSIKLLYDTDTYETTSILHVVQFGLNGPMTLFLDKTLIHDYNAVRYGLQPSSLFTVTHLELSTFSNVSHALHSLHSFHTPISFSNNLILHFHFLLFLFLYFLIFLFVLCSAYSLSMDYIFTGAAGLNAMSKVKCALPVNLVGTWETSNVCAHFNTGWLYVKQFQK